MDNQIPKVYEHQGTEQKWYKFWEESGFFKPAGDPNKKAFSVVIPPPNVTGQLHMGHAMDETLQDVLVRYHRMKGEPTLWVPGTDHAGIATEVKVKDKLLAEEGLTKYDIGREAFLQRVWDWKNTYGSRIENQLRAIGASCDWSRTRFTMDEGCSRAVREVFTNLYNKGLITRKGYIINWCPVCNTTLSDIEVEYENQPSSLWHLRYPFKDGSGSLVVATTRPETMLGDTAVAVNPNDERYKDLVGKTLILPLIGREIPVIADDYVDLEFGTGCVKVTPSHDPNDFQMGLRHDLPQITVIGFDGCMTEEAGKYAGLDRYEARKAIVADLEAEGALVKIEKHDHNVGSCYRCGTTVEPLVSTQWFVKMEELAKPALEAVQDGRIRFVPDRFSKIYTYWMENIKDWCISRQLWWGHRIPAWYCADCGHMTVAKEDPTCCEKCGSKNINQDEDVLDTWFSSALWPFSTMGWPEKTADLEKFFPTSVLVTGYDIIFFWVARMIFSALEHTGEIPFSTVFIHGLVRDDQGRKMSKSLGNGVDPLQVIDQYGCDTLRFSLLTGNAPGNDIRFQWDKVESSRSFANKIWNAARFLLMSIDDTVTGKLDPATFTNGDKWILTRLNEVIPDVTRNIDNFELGIASQKLYSFLWTEFCDWYIEMIKSRLYGDDPAAKTAALNTAAYVLSRTLELLHPFMPYITEEIWQHLPHEGQSIMVTQWPETDESLMFPEAKDAMEIYMEAVRALRALRRELNVPPSKKAPLIIATEQRDLFQAGAQVYMDLASVSDVTVLAEGAPAPEKTVSAVVSGATFYVPLADLVDLSKEKERAEKEAEKIRGEIARAEAKLANESFVAKAPAQLVENEKKKLADAKEKLAAVEERLRGLEA